MVLVAAMWMAMLMTELCVVVRMVAVVVIIAVRLWRCISGISGTLK